MVNYYHRFLHGIAATLAPLHAQASGKGQKIDWSKECQEAFDKTKEMLSKAVLLHHPRSDAFTTLLSMRRTQQLAANSNSDTAVFGFPLPFSPGNCLRQNRNIVLLIENFWRLTLLSNTLDIF